MALSNPVLSEADGTKLWNKRRGRRKTAFGRAVESFVC